MKRLLLLALTPLILLVLFVADASACNRCGLFGRNCRFASHHVAAVEVASVGYAAPAPSNQTFNFVNNGYGGLPLAAQGQTVFGNQPYGFQAAASAYALDPNAVLANFARLANVGLDGYSVTAQAAIGQHGEAQKILAQGYAATAALSAAKGSDSPPSVQSFSVKIENGQPTIVQNSVAGGVGAGASGASVQAFGVPRGLVTSLDAVLKSRCISCHTEGKASGGLDLSNLEAVPFERFVREDNGILARIESSDPQKRMPKGQPPLGWKEKTQFHVRSEALRNGK